MICRFKIISILLQISPDDISMITERIQSGEIPDSVDLNESMTLQTRSITPIYDDCQKLDGDTPLDESNLNSVLQQNISISIFSRIFLSRRLQ